MMRPFGSPPTPRARSIASEPVESVSTFIFALLPSRMIEPSPNCLLMEESASSTFLSRTCVATGATAPLDTLAGAAFDMGRLRISGVVREHRGSGEGGKHVKQPCEGKQAPLHGKCGETLENEVTPPTPVMGRDRGS